MATVEQRTVACNHCGTVLRALTPWTANETAGCDCLCHNARRYDSLTYRERKKLAKT